MTEKQKALDLSKALPGTRKQIRTATPFQAPPPQGGASANFATRVFLSQIYIYSENKLKPS